MKYLLFIVIFNFYILFLKKEAENISFLFCDLISKYKNANAGRELIESLNSAKTLNILFNKLFCKVKKNF